MLIDAHVHLFSRRFYQFWCDQSRVPLDKAAATIGMEIPDDDDLAPLAERWLAEMDKHRVDRAVLLSSVIGDGGALGRVVAKHPKRFCGLFLLNPTLEDSMSRLKRGLGEAGLCGACLYPALHHYYPDDERLHAIFTTLDRANAAAFVHFGMLKIPIQDKLGIAPSVDLKYSNPLRLHSICNAFPNLKFIIPHFGAGYFTETLMLGAQAKNVYVDTSSSNDWIKLHSGLTLETVFDKVLQIFGPNRVLFGTDSSAFPRGWRKDNHERQKLALDKINAPKADQEKIFGLNLAGLLKWN